MNGGSEQRANIEPSGEHSSICPHANPSPRPCAPTASLLSLPLPAVVLTLSHPAPTLSQTQVHSCFKHTRCQLNSPAVRVPPLTVSKWFNLLLASGFSPLDVVFLKLYGSSCSITPTTEQNLSVSLELVVGRAPNMAERI